MVASFFRVDSSIDNLEVSISLSLMIMMVKNMIQISLNATEKIVMFKAQPYSTVLTLSLFEVAANSTHEVFPRKFSTSHHLFSQSKLLGT